VEGNHNLETRESYSLRPVSATTPPRAIQRPHAQERNAVRERDLRFWFRDLIYALEHRQDEIGNRLEELWHGAPEKRPGESETCWQGLAMLHSLVRTTLAAYSILSFADARSRSTFTEQPRLRDELITRTLGNGGVRGDDGVWQQLLN
jgi:hypothetical protein